MRVRMLGLALAAALAASARPRRRAAISQPDGAHRRAVLRRQQHRRPGPHHRRQAREMWKQQVIVENRPGVAGTASVAKAAPDGYTLMLTSSGHPVANVINPTAPFDPVKDFAGVTQVTAVPAALVVPPDLPANNRQGIHRARQAEAGRAQFRLGRHRQHVLSRRRGVQAGRQDRHRAHSPQGRAGGDDQHPAQRLAALFRQRHLFAPN